MGLSCNNSCYYVMGLLVQLRSSEVVVALDTEKGEQVTCDGVVHTWVQPFSSLSFKMTCFFPASSVI